MLPWLRQGLAALPMALFLFFAVDASMGAWVLFVLVTAFAGVCMGIVGVGGVVVNGRGEVLLVQERVSPSERMQGSWKLPGGLAEPGEVLAAGGKVATVLDVSDVYMTIFLPTAEAGKVRVGAEARIILDALPDYVVPAEVSFVAAEAQFTPKSVETRTEREKLMFRVRIRIDPELLRAYRDRVKTGVPGEAYVRLDERQPWPEALQVALPDA